MIHDFEMVPHTADIQIRVYGNSIPELFRHALIGMFQSIEPQATGCSLVEGRLVCTDLERFHAITVTSPDREALLVDFLSEALYLSDVHNEAYLDVNITDLEDTKMAAMLYGVAVQGFGIEIKAVTYHNLAITEKNGLWQTEIVFDI